MDFMTKRRNYFGYYQTASQRQDFDGSRFPMSKWSKSLKQAGGLPQAANAQPWRFIVRNRKNTLKAVTAALLL